MKKLIYLAGKITGLSWTEAESWRIRFEDTLTNIELYDLWKCFDPCKHDTDFGERLQDDEFMKYDLDMLRHSRLMVVSFEFGQDSIGTAIEVGVAYENHIPIIGYNPNDDIIYPWYKNACIHICKSWEGLIMFLCDNYLSEV